MKYNALIPGCFPWVTGLLVGVMGTGGCTSSTPAKNAACQDNLIKIGIAYVRFNEQYQRGPSSAEELQPLLKELGEPTELLFSPDDHEPYVICWGLDLRFPQASSSAFSLLAYEQRGRGGQRFVMSTNRWVGRKTDEEFCTLAFPRGFQPPP